MWSSVTHAISVQDLFVFVAVCTATGVNDPLRLATANVSSSNVLVGTLKPYTEYQVQVVALVKGQTNRTIAMRSSTVVLLQTKEDGEFFAVKVAINSKIFVSKCIHLIEFKKKQQLMLRRIMQPPPPPLPPPHLRGGTTLDGLFKYAGFHGVRFACGFGPRKVCFSLWIGIAGWLLAMHWVLCLQGTIFLLKWKSFLDRCGYILQPFTNSRGLK